MRFLRVFRPRDLRRDKRGVAAVEFALILPMFVMIYMCSVEITELLLANRRVENLAASAADIVARDTMVTDAELNDLETALDLLLSPNTSAGMSARVSSITIDTDGSAEVVWSRSYNDYPALAAGDDVVDLPSDLTEDDNTPSIVRAEVIYDYQSPLRWMLPGPFRLTHSEYRRPRLVDPVPLCSSNCS